MTLSVSAVRGASRQPGVPSRRLGLGLAGESELVRESGAGGAAGAPENKVRV